MSQASPRTLTFQVELVESESGWAKSWLLLDGDRFDVECSCCTDTPTQMADVALALAYRSGLATHNVVFDAERYGALAVFRHRDPTEFELYDIDDPLQPLSANRTPRCNALVDSTALAISVGTTPDQLPQRHGIREYYRIWDELNPFPLLQYPQPRLLPAHSAIADSMCQNGPQDSISTNLSSLLMSTPQWGPPRLDRDVGKLGLVSGR
ncbi:MAG: hypothetical protein IT435_03290 [Phycisphaerales bacterium]|nr:hypothetical protein [Phycisphaerales bacterium]